MNSSKRSFEPNAGLFRKTVAPRSRPLSTVLSAGTGLLLGLNNQAVATIIAFGTGELYAMFTVNVLLNGPYTIGGRTIEIGDPLAIYS